MTQLMHFPAGPRDFGVIVGPRGFIISENDFCHAVYQEDEPADLNVAEPLASPAYYPFTLTEIRGIAKPVESMREWSHYWGIKRRVHGNYLALLRSMREIGADLKLMPEWGK